MRALLAFEFFARLDAECVGEGAVVLVLVLVMVRRDNTVTGHLRFDDPGT